MRAYIEQNPEDRHIIIGGFVGSRYEEVGRALGASLGRGVLDTLHDPQTRLAWTLSPEIASRMEGFELLALAKLRPYVALMRTFAYARVNAIALTKYLGAVRIFIDTPREVCEQRIYHPDFTDDEKIRRRALSDLYQYQEHGRVAMYQSDIVVPTDINGHPNTLTSELLASVVLAKVASLQSPN